MVPFRLLEREDRRVSSLISLDAVSRRYEVGGGTVTALADVDLDVDAGEFLVVLGPSGSGKTTLLNLIGALDVPSEGVITIAGHQADRREPYRPLPLPARAVSFVFQTFNLFRRSPRSRTWQFGVDVTGRRDRSTASEMLERVASVHRCSTSEPAVGW